ncbi:MAG: lysylphosphatidylglycerol synthase transmembrane domain-containing protein [Caldilineaceae bacterium]
MNNQPQSSSLPVALPQVTARRLIVLAALAVLTVALLLTVGGGATALAALATVNLAWIGFGVLIHYSGFVVRGWRWQRLLAMVGHRLRWRTLMTLLLSGWFVSALLPARAGDLLRVAALRLPDVSPTPVPVAVSLSSIVLERVLDLLALLLLGATIGFVLLRTALPGWIMAIYGVGLLALILVVSALVIAPTLLQWLRSWSGQPWWQKLLDFGAELVQSLRTLGLQPQSAVAVIIASLYIWLCDALLLWCVLHSMGVAAPFSSIAFVALTVDMVAAIPLTPGGIGQIEAANVALLALLPLPPFNLAAAVLLNRTISYWSFLLFSGFVTFFAGIGQLFTSGKGTNNSN